jgi:hypothetical protein
VTASSLPQPRRKKDIIAQTNPLTAARLLYDRKEAARMLSISIRTLDYLIAAKQFDIRRLGRKVMILHGSLSRFAQGNHYESPKEMAAAA